MRIVRWIGGVVAASAVVVAAILSQAGASPGDAMVIKCYPGACNAPQVLTTPQKASLSSCLAQTLPGVTSTKILDAVVDLNAAGKGVGTFVHNKTLNKRNYVAAAAKRRGKKIKVVAGGQVTFEEFDRTALATSELSCFQSWASGVFSGITTDQMSRLTIKKGEVDLTAIWWQHETLTPDEFVADKVAERIREQTGTVE